MHDVRLIEIISLLGHVLIFVVGLLLGYGLRVNGRKDLFFRKLLRLEILSNSCLLVSDCALGLVEGPSGHRNEFFE